MKDGSGDFSIGSDIWPGISKLIEEAGETLQICGKLMATAGREEHWDKTNLRERLVEELGDLSAAITFVVNVNGMEEDVVKRGQAKLAMFYAWHQAQKQSKQTG